MSSEQQAKLIKSILDRLDVLEARTHINYAKGSFVPTLVGAGTAGTFTYTANATVVEWTRIGNRLLFNGRISISATSVAPTGNLSINGWSYPGVSDANMAIAGVGIVTWRSITLPANYWTVLLQFSSSSSTALLVRSGTNVTLGVVQGAELTGGVYDFRFGGDYRIA